MAYDTIRERVGDKVLAVDLDKKKKAWDAPVKQDRCHSKAYDMHQSTSSQMLSNQSTSLTYGSAKLEGFMWQDYTCLQPLDLHGNQGNLLNSTFLARVSDKNANDYNVEKEKKFLEQSYEFQNKNKCSFF